ncbi:MAG: glucose-1-phosphate adenylyltransferase, partial [Fretibacterium sp.]|nr:glucose-1-phosphate adenylyltransferase [Fretibacterium sp.]
MNRGKHGRVLGIVLAGGKGERLMPLTRYRAKPAVYFASKYRIIDFALSNLVNSGILAIYVLVQFKSQSLNEHIERGWQFGGAMRGRDFFVTLVPAQMWRGEHWFQGTADAVFQNLHLVSLFNADRVCIFAADHIYKMDVEQMLDWHLDNQADVTIAANVVPTAEAHQFGCIKTDSSGRIIEFMEKPATPPEIPGKPGFSYVSMGNYIFDRGVLEEALIFDSQQPSSHDFGRDIIPRLVSQNARLFAYDFMTNELPHSRGRGSEQMNRWRADKPYWRDVGTINAYWQAHMELLDPDSEMTLYNPMWPIRTVSFADPPSYSYPVNGFDCTINRMMAAEGSRILGAHVSSSILSRNCVIQSGSVIDESIIGQSVVIGHNCRIKKTIIDSHNFVPDNTVIGEDPEEDARNYFVD